jgi:arylsulfatase A-like enzyme
MSETRPNILFINTDEQRQDTLSCYGNGIVNTPHIDDLANRGVRFDDAHCTHPLCTPARGSLLTGRLPSTNGQWRNGIALSEEETTIADCLRDVGYRTGLIGKAHFTPFQGNPEKHPESVQLKHPIEGTDEVVVPEEECWKYWREFDGPYYGFDHIELALGHGDFGINGGHYGLWLAENHPNKRDLFFQDAAIEQTDERFNSWKSPVPAEIHSTTWVTDRTIEFMDAAGDNPFFAWVGIPDPHFPYDPPEPYCYMYDPDDMPRPIDPNGEVWDDRDPPRYVEYYLEHRYPEPWNEITEEIQREIYAHYYGMCTMIDDAVGRILDALDRLGIADNTIVVFTSDHGDWLGDHGLWQKGAVHTRGVTQVPLVIRWPGVEVPGRIVEHVTSHVDIMPTLLDAADVEIPYGVQGKSLRPVIDGRTEAVRPYALVEHRHEAYRPGSEYVRKHDDKIPGTLINWSQEDIRVETLLSNRYRLSHVTGTETEYGELIDRVEDPKELNNLWDDRPDLRDQLIHQLLDATMKNRDPLPERHWPV